jgi:hypothetical protein
VPAGVGGSSGPRSTAAGGPAACTAAAAAAAAAGAVPGPDLASRGRSCWRGDSGVPGSSCCRGTAADRRLTAVHARAACDGLCARQEAPGRASHLVSARRCMLRSGHVQRRQVLGCASCCCWRPRQRTSTLQDSNHASTRGVL